MGIGLTPLLTRRISFKFLAAVTTAVGVIFVVLFLWISHVQEEQIMDQVRNQAIILHKQIVLTRHWVARHGPLLVKKRDGIESNPYLTEPDVQATEGTVYTKITPSILTRHLSEMAGGQDAYAFRLTSLKYVNPENAPDQAEIRAFDRFKTTGGKGFFSTVTLNGRKTLRYLAPVYIDSSCLRCHKTENYKPGDVGGCLSVFVPMEKARRAVRQNQAALLWGGVVLAGSLVLLIFVATRALFFKRISRIRTAMGRLKLKEDAGDVIPEGDELKEIAKLCSLVDYTLAHNREDLERRIAEATEDLSRTNRNLEDANRQLVGLNKAKSDFFSDISHELRTPLTCIKGAADILERKAACVDTGYLEIIRRNTDHLIKKVLDFLDYSKIESGQLDLHIEPTRLRSIAEQAIESHRVLAEERSVILVLHSEGDPVVPADGQRIYQVFTNLISNAVRFSPAGEKITVEIAAHNGEVEVSVKDEGPGLDAYYHEAVFEKFYQVPEQDSGKMHEGSSGIGLAICKGLVEAHHGRIRVESEPGRGCSFSFTLPVNGG
jgi:signal transduction histidine kinase